MPIPIFLLIFLPCQYLYQNIICQYLYQNIICQYVYQNIICQYLYQNIICQYLYQNKQHYIWVIISCKISFSTQYLAIPIFSDTNMADTCLTDMTIHINWYQYRLNISAQQIIVPHIPSYLVNLNVSADLLSLPKDHSSVKNNSN